MSKTLHAQQYITSELIHTVNQIWCYCSEFLTINMQK